MIAGPTIPARRPGSGVRPRAGVRGTVVVGLALGAAACATAPTAAPTPTPTVAPPSAASLRAVVAAARATGAQTAAVSMSLAAARVFGPGTPPVSGTGFVDFGAGRGHLVLHQPSGDETVVFQPSSVFVRQPPVAAGALPRGKRWIAAGLTESPAVSTNFPQFVVQAEGTNPAFLLDEVTWGAAWAAPLGPSTVDGAAARGYLVGVDLDQAFSTATGPSRTAFTRAVGYEITAAGGGSPGAASGNGIGSGGVTATGTPVERVRVWVGAGGRVVQLQASPPGSGVGVTTMAFSSFGTAVRVTNPPSSQVVDIASLSPGGERENNGGGDSDGG